MNIVVAIRTEISACRDDLAGFIARMPIEDDCEFQRGFLAGLLSAYESVGFDRGDARYLAGRRQLDRMNVVSGDVSPPHKPE